MKYFSSIIDNMAKNADNMQVCCLDFLVDDIAKASMKKALAIEESYNDNRISGSVYCTYRTVTLLSSGIKNMLELLKLHDQVFLVNGDINYMLQKKMYISYMPVPLSDHSVVTRARSLV